MQSGWSGVNWKRIGLVGVAGAVTAAAFLVGRGSAGSSHPNAASRTSTSAVAVTTSVSTTAAVPVASSTTTSPRVSPVVPSISQISFELSRTVEIADRTTHFSANDDPVTVSDGAGGWLTGIVAGRFPTADGHGQLVFFWHNTTFIGLDSHVESIQIMRLVAAGTGTLTVRYTQYASTDALCCPSLAPATIDFHWDGHTMTSSGVPPGHRAGEAATVTTLP
jgi:hypothetical protein